MATRTKFTEYVVKLLRRAERLVSAPRELRGSYLKLETGLRPELRVLSTGWPRIHLTSNCCVSAFAPPHHDTDTTPRMTRKSGNKLLAARTKNSSSAAGAGYCEVCRVNYEWLEEHVSSVGHIKAVTEPSQYQELDSLISAASCTSTWLGQRKSSRIVASPPRRSPPSPTVLNCNGHEFTHQGLSNGVSRGSGERKSPGVRRGRVVRKRLSAEEKLIEDNRAYYRVEVLNSKLRSTGTLQRQLGSSGGPDDGEEKSEGASMGGILGSSSLDNGQATNNSVVVRFRKVRRTELSVLSDEAENFMFGEREEARDDDDLRTVSPNARSAQVESGVRKKRRTHAELFIEDNADYYKFEPAGSRLRYQGTTLAHVPAPGKDESALSRLRSNRSPLCEDRVPTRLRSAKEEPTNHRTRSYQEQEDNLHHRHRSFRSPGPDEPLNNRNRGKSPFEPHHHHRLRSNRSPVDEEPPVNHHRLRSDRSPTFDELPLSNLRLKRSTRSPNQDEEPLVVHRRLRRSTRSPNDDESPGNHHRLRRSTRSPNDEGPPAGHHRLRSNRSPNREEPVTHHRLRSNRSPLEEESATPLRLRSIKSPPVEDSPASHHRLRSGDKSPKEEPLHLRSKWNRSPTEDQVTNHPRLRSWGRGSTDEEPSNHRLRSSRNPYEDEDSMKPPDSCRPGLRSSSTTPPPLEPKLRSCPGLSPVKEKTVERAWLPSEEDLAPELTLTHSDITYAFEMNNPGSILSTQVQERLDNFKEELLPRYFTYPSVTLPCEMPYLDRLKLLTRRRRRISRCLDDKPRKSPRCHASTLAILSSSGVPTRATTCGAVVTPVPASQSPTANVPTEPIAAEDEDTTASSLTAESVLSDPSNDPRALYFRYMSNFASLLDCVKFKDSNAWQPTVMQEDNSVMCQVSPPNPDFLSMMDNNKCPELDTCLQETVFSFRAFDLDSCNSSDCSEIFGFSEDGRSYFSRRKKKKRHNLTGWPKEKPKRKLLAYAKKPRFIKSEPLTPHTDSEDFAQRDLLPGGEAFTPPKKKRGRPRLYPPGLSPSSLKAKLARENALRRSVSLSPFKPRPSLKAHPL